LGRTWLSVPIGHSGIRIGRSWADRQPAKIPRWRVYELTEGLLEAAAKRGEKMTRAHARYLVEKARAYNELDGNGYPVFSAAAKTPAN
jgi:hypothetical protein